MRHVISTPMATSNTPRKKHREARARKGGGKSGTWAMALFALPFAAVGVGMLLFGVLPTLYDWGRMQSWQPVSATLVSARLETSRGSKSTTYSVSASYRYQVAGRDYQGQRVAIGSGADNIGDFQEQLGERLEAAQRQGQPVQAWVNPSNPREAVLDRSLRPGMQLFKMLFVVLFGGVGLGMLHGAWRGPRAGRGAQALEASAQPWMGRPAWAGNSIRSNKRHEVWVAWTFALVCNAIAWPSAIAHRDEALDGPQYLLVAVFGALLLAAVATLVWAVRATLDAWRFGDVRLVLDPFPGAIGGDFGPGSSTSRSRSAACGTTAAAPAARASRAKRRYGRARAWPRSSPGAMASSWVCACGCRRACPPRSRWTANTTHGGCRWNRPIPGSGSCVCSTCRCTPPARHPAGRARTRRSIRGCGKCAAPKWPR
jgi:hypothetical protein